MNGILHKFSIALTSILFIALLAPGALYAGPGKGFTTYQDSITRDEEEFRLSTPTMVLTDQSDGEIYVLSRGRIHIYTNDLFPLMTLDRGRGVEAPQGLALDNGGNLYVSQPGTEEGQRHRISVFDACLKLEREIHFEGFQGADAFAPYRLAVDRKGNIYVTGNPLRGILVLDNGGRLIEIMGPEENGTKADVNDVSIDREGRIYLLSEEMGRIYVYDENRAFLFKFGQKGGSTGKLSRPRGMGVDSRTGRTYVVDYMRHTVTSYDRDGRFIFEFGGRGWGEGWFQYPVDLDVDTSGRILVADTFNNRVELFSPEERRISEYIEMLYGKKRRVLRDGEDMEEFIIMEDDGHPVDYQESRVYGAPYQE